VKFVFKIFVFVLLCFQTSLAQQVEQKKKFVLGVVDSIYSTELNEYRVLNIYLPSDYDSDSLIKYPVIYLLDGSADEDFIHISGIVQFLNYSWINVLPKSIVVGISNVDRKRDFTFPTTIEKDKRDFPTTGGSSKFISFIERELKPYINKNYKVNSHATLIGQSLGGLLATEILIKKTNLFDQYIIISPSLWWNNESLLKEMKNLNANAFKPASKIFIGVGKEGKIMENDAKKLYKDLVAKKVKGAKIAFKYYPERNHGDVLHLAVYDAFEKFNEKNKQK